MNNKECHRFSHTFERQRLKIRSSAIRRIGEDDSLADMWPKATTMRWIALISSQKSSFCSRSCNRVRTATAIEKGIVMDI